MIKKVNCQSDFSFLLNLTDSHNTAIGFPEWDWAAKFFVAGSANIYEASHIGGICTNCADADGTIRIVFNESTLPAGVLKMELTAEIPDATYPDKTQKVVVPATLGIELVKEATTFSPSIEETVVLPIVLPETPKEEPAESEETTPAE